MTPKLQRMAPGRMISPLVMHKGITAVPDEVHVTICVPESGDQVLAKNVLPEVVVQILPSPLEYTIRAHGEILPRVVQAQAPYTGTASVTGMKTFARILGKQLLTGCWDRLLDRGVSAVGLEVRIEVTVTCGRARTEWMESYAARLYM